MHSRRTYSTFLILICILALASSALADEVVRQGGEFFINTHTTANQGFPDLASDGNGTFVATWESQGQDGDGFGISAQRQTAAGTPLGTEFQVNTYTTDNQWDPAVSMAPGGEFVIVWASLVDGNQFGIAGQRYDADGVALGTEFIVNTFTAGDQHYPAIAHGSNGDFLVVWESLGQDQSFGGIYGQLFDSAGQPSGSEFRVNTTTLDEQNDVKVAAKDGGFLVVWESDGIDGDGEAVVMQELDTTGAPVGGEIQVNSSSSGDQEDPDISVLPGGTFAVVWESDGQDGSGETIVAQVFGADGLPIGSELIVNSTVTADQNEPQVAAVGTDHFFAIWQDSSGMDDDVRGRRFDVAGQPAGDELLLNTSTADDQDEPSVAADVNGRLLTVWRSFGDHDGEAAGVGAQRLDTALFANGFESGDTLGWSSATQ